MKIARTLVPLALAALAFTAVARGDTPFPGPQITGDVFVIANTVTSDNALQNYFAPGSTVYFRSYAVDGKTRKLVTSKHAKYYYAKIPGAANVKMRYLPRSPYATGRYKWIGRWTVPANYSLGIVNFAMLVKTKSKRNGIFHQIPVPSSQLTIMNNPPAPWARGPGSKSSTSTKVNVALYADAVNGTAPPGAVRRPIGCTQTNVFKRGERVVIRTWGYDLASGEILTIDNVMESHTSVAGVPNVKLDWGAHGPAAARVWFWSNFWIISADYPLGDAVIHVRFNLVDGKVGAIDVPITIVP